MNRIHFLSTVLAMGFAALPAWADYSAVDCFLRKDLDDQQTIVGNIYIDLDHATVNIFLNDTFFRHNSTIRRAEFAEKGFRFSGQSVVYERGNRHAVNWNLTRGNPDAPLEGEVQLGDAFDDYQNPATPDYDLGKYSSYYASGCREIARTR